ncbi:MAG TPA: hypothetical protein VFU10_07820 [Gaiellaceae bacterium]|nr:hypothetical protein [Gaiellaceae bacterium]
MPAVAPVDARHALFGRLIDHAPTFPPAELPLAEALADHAAARAGDTAWIASRFVVRASQHAELPADDPPRLSVVLDMDLCEWASTTGPGVEALIDDPRIEALELRAADAREHEGMTGYEQVFVEVPAGPDLAPAGGGWFAKVRCGGAKVPSVAELAAFIRACKQGVPFKATAGLHHAVRTEREHGLCNLLAAVLFDDEEAALGETDPATFWLTGGEFGWRDRTAATHEIAAARRRVLLSVGSCSFDEPVAELQALGLL